jgi:hypothetical protein
MNFGIVVEDNRDAEAYEQLIRKIRGDVENVVSFPCHGVATLKKKFVNGLNYFKYGAPHSIGKALVIMDSDCSEALVWEEKLEQVCQRSRFEATFPVRFHATKCELESWLLVDENAINEVSKLRGQNKQIVAAKIEFESFKHAKELFHQRLLHAGLPADPRVYNVISLHTDIERVVLHCPNFRKFMEKVRN